MIRQTTITYTGLKIFSAEFVRMWAIREEVLHVTRVGQVMNCFRKKYLAKFLISIYQGMYWSLTGSQSFSI